MPQSVQAIRRSYTPVPGFNPGDLLIARPGAGRGHALPAKRGLGRGAGGSRGYRGPGLREDRPANDIGVYDGVDLAQKT